jgi:hypothetical protein
MPTMDTLSILSTLDDLGARIEVKAGRLRIHAGDQSIPAGVIEAVRAAKSELLKLVDANHGMSTPEKMLKTLNMLMVLNMGTGEHLTPAPMCSDDGTADPGKAPKMPMMPNVGTGEHLTAAPATRLEWSTEDWLAFYVERSAIAQHDAGQSKSQAEARAFECCVAEWLTQHPVASDPDAGCDWCHTEKPGYVILPVGLEKTGVAWVHDECWPAWHQQRRVQAISALAQLGIPPPRATAATSPLGAMAVMEEKDG